MFIRGTHTTAVSVGEIIKDLLEARGWTQKELAKRMGFSEKHISKLMDGEVELSDDAALRLEAIFSIPAKSWLSFDASFRADKIQAQKELASEEEEKVFRLLPYQELAKRNWIASVSTLEKKIFACRQFFGVADLTVLPSIMGNSSVCFRQKKVTEKARYATFAWIQKVRNEALGKTVRSIDSKGLARECAKLRSLTGLPQNEVISKLETFLGQYGVALVVLPHLSGSFLHGTSERMGEKIVLGLTVRGKDADIFWFSLFHEIGHICLNHLAKKERTNKMELEADNWAKNALIPSDEYEGFLSERKFSKIAVEGFAKEIGVHPGIVVGRLQSEKLIPFRNLNGMKLQYSLEK